MQTEFHAKYSNSPTAKKAEDILRKCVHCGFCTATCPTYQITGNELDSPRGRIYQIKKVFEGEPANTATQTHLDRCLTCRSCETTCPSGVEYAELLDIGRSEVEQQVSRKLSQTLTIKLLNATLPYAPINHLLFKPLSFLKPLIPNKFSSKIPKIRKIQPVEIKPANNTKTVFLLEGCVQSTISPNTNQAAVKVLNQLGYQVIRQKAVKCCGALSHHTNQHDQAISLIRAQLKQWQELQQTQAIDYIVSTASGCGVMLKDYPRLIPQNEKEKYAKILDKIVDLSELLDIEIIQAKLNPSKQSIAYHAPCTLNHGQKLSHPLKQKLIQLGYDLKTPKDEHICCGSAGSYSILQAELSKQLQQHKIKHLLETKPELIITANVGCEHHLQSVSHIPVKHWIEIISEDLI